MSKDAGRSSLKTVLDSLGVGKMLETATDFAGPCDCEVSVSEEALTLEASGCDGDLRTASGCRRTVVGELRDREIETIVVRSDGLEYRYDDRFVELVSAAGRFIELVDAREPRLAELAAGDPLAAADEAAGRAGAIYDGAVESGLLRSAEGLETYGDEVAPAVGLGIAYYLIDRTVPEGATLREVRELSTDSEVRIYTRSDSVPLYALDIADLALPASDHELLVDGYELIAEGVVEGDQAASRAMERVTDGPLDPVLSGILEKHTRGYGVLEDLFADPEVTDVYVTAPVPENPIRVVVDGETMATNVRLTTHGVKALASRVRRTSGRSFSRASPTVDASAELEDGTEFRIAGVTDPISTGVAFAFRERADDRFTLPALVENGTMSADAAGLLSVAVERGASLLIAGTRGAGKTTLLGTLLYELTPDTRTVVIEDTPELPVGSLQSVDRDVQALRTGTGDGPEIEPTDALRTALRLGDGALVVGEIRGEEAQVLYEAMRVGANANAVLGTIHGDGAEEVKERVVADLGVPPTSFAATDLVVTIQAHRTETGRERRLGRIEEVDNEDDDVFFQSLYEPGGDGAVATGRIDQGVSDVVGRLAEPGEQYGAVKRHIDDRTEFISTLARNRQTSPKEVAAAYAGRGVDPGQ